jgi:hypothetical protein
VAIGDSTRPDPTGLTISQLSDIGYDRALTCLYHTCDNSSPRQAWLEVRELLLTPGPGGRPAVDVLINIPAVLVSLLAEKIRLVVSGAVLAPETDVVVGSVTLAPALFDSGPVLPDPAAGVEIDEAALIEGHAHAKAALLAALRGDRLPEAVLKHLNDRSEMVVEIVHALINIFGTVLASWNELIESILIAQKRVFIMSDGGTSEKAYQ